MIDGLLQDMRFGARLIAKHPLLSAATILTLTIGIGLDAGVFTLVDGVLFRPRVAHDPASFVEVRTRSLMSLEEYEAFHAARSLRAITAWAPVHASIDGTPVLPLLVTCNFFAVYAPASPIVGRTLTPADCASPEAGRVVVIGEHLWRTHFSADPSILGRTLTLNVRDFTIVGVMPAGYDGELRGPIWIPYTMASAFFGGRALPRERATPWLLGMTGRLAPEATRASARAELQVIAARIASPAPAPTVDVTDGSMITGPEIRAMQAWIVPTVIGAISTVLVISSLNVAILMLSRAHARQKEIALRLSIGATRGRLVRMLLVESVMLALAAAVPSALLADRIPPLVHLLVPTMPYYPLDVNRRVLFYIAGTAMLAGIVSGIAPAMESMNANRWRSTGGLVASQVAMTLVLLVIAAMFVRTERRIASTGAGYETDHLIVAVPHVDLPPYTAATAAAFYRNLRDDVGSLPGVRAVAYSDWLGFDDGGAAMPATVVADASGRTANTDQRHVSSTFFETAGLPIVRGAPLRDDPVQSGATPVLVSESLAQTLWPDQDPLGARVHVDGRPMEVAGIVRDVRSMFNSNHRTIYETASALQPGAALFVRFEGDGRAAASRVRATIADLDPNAVTDPRTLTAIRQDLADRFMRVVDMVVILALVAFALAIVGIYGAVAFSVSRRTKELGIRVALGATANDVTRLVLRTGLEPIGIGLAAGLVATFIAAFGLARVFRDTPARPDISDPIAYVSVTILLVATALVAMLGPCRRAASADPVHALRHD